MVLIANCDTNDCRLHLLRVNWLVMFNKVFVSVVKCCLRSRYKSHLIPQYPICDLILMAYFL